MLFISCDPGPKNCAITVVQRKEIIDITGDTMVIQKLNEFKVIYSICVNLGNAPDLMALNLAKVLSSIEEKYPNIQAAFVEVQGIKHNNSIYAINVYNNIAQAAFTSFFPLCHYLSITWYRRSGEDISILAKR